MMDVRKQLRAKILKRHLGRLETRLAALAAVDHRFFLARLGALLLGGAVLGAVFWGSDRASLYVLICWLAAFAVIVFLHRRLDRTRARFELAARLTRIQLARLHLDWDEIPAAPEIPIERAHPFAGDLNLLGKRSLHQLIDTAVSQGGSGRLASWLLNTAPDLAHIERRQSLLQEMLPLTGLLRGLIFNGMSTRAKRQDRWQGEDLLRWLQKNRTAPNLVPVIVLLFCLGIANTVALILSVLEIWPAYWLVGATAYMILYQRYYREYRDLADEVHMLGEALIPFQAVLRYLEKYPYPTNSALAHLCRVFWQGENRPSRYLRKMAWYTSLVSLGTGSLWSIFINAVVPWNLLFAYLLNRYKESLRDSLPLWLDAWYELEALVSLANFAYLNPGYVFPQIAEKVTEKQPAIEAVQIGHPLLPDDVKVCNDFSLRGLGDVVLLTGSNMSGKSTFLRTLGMNLCLAFSGSVVNAASLHVSLFHLFTCIQVSDSLNDGISYFYAEVLRLKTLLDASQRQDDCAQAPPLFFLIDELFRGTNNRERRIGGRSYVRSLTNGNGMGLISTHDLELAQLAEAASSIQNYHFREEVHDGKMFFDYRLRPGPCPTTNALKIMALEGLPVDEKE